MVKSFDSEKLYIGEGGIVFTTATLKTNYVNTNNRLVSSPVDFNKIRTYNSVGFDTFDRSWEPTVTTSEEGVNIRGTIDWNYIPRVHYEQEYGMVSEKGDVVVPKEEIDKIIEQIKGAINGR